MAGYLAPPRSKWAAASVLTRVATAPSERKADFRPDVEGLRAVAILLVVAFHAGVPGWTGGFVGVDVFFVVSGYLITGLLVHEVERTGRVGLVHFYARRVRRLLPASALMLVVTVAVGALVLSPLERARYARAATAAALYVSNIWFQRQSASYFAPDVGGNPFLHTWSLAVEEQFYLLWPLVIALTFAASRSKRALAAVMLAASFASAVAALWLVTVNQPAAFYASPARAWEFGIGGVASLVPASLLARFAGRAQAAGALGLAMIVGGGVLLTPTTVYPGVAVFLPVVGTAAVLLAGAATSAQGVSGVLATPTLQHIGRLSYSWYLWHWPVLVLGAVVFPGLAVPGRVGLALGALGLAAGCHALVENPIRFNRYLTARPALTLGLAALVTTASATVGRRATVAADVAARSPEQRAITVATRSIPRPLYRAGCLLDFRDVRLGDCTFGDTTSAAAIVLFGDSHAAQWFSAYEAIARARRWRLMALTKSGCPTARVAVARWTTHQPYPECTAWREAALHRILVLKPALVVIGNSDGHVTWPDHGGGTRLSLRQWRDGMRATLALLDDAGIRTVVLRDPPGAQLDVPTCLARAVSHGRSVTACDVARRAAMREDVFRATQSAATALSHVSLVDLSDQFCDAATCPAVRDGIIVYRDPGHITDAFARRVAEGGDGWRLAPAASPAACGTSAAASAGCATRGSPRAAEPAPPRRASVAG